MKIYELITQMAIEHKTIFDMPLRVTYYARVSTKTDIQLNSQENQIQTFNNLIDNNKNWIKVEGYVDTIRGESAANRENFLRMIKDGKNGKFDLIVCKEISRFSRDLLDSIGYTRELLAHDVGVYFTSDNICTIDRDAELRLGIMTSIAQEEVARLSQRIKFGHKRAIEDGVVLGNSRIYGYTKKDGKLIIDTKQAEMIEFIFNKFVSGNYSLRQMETELFHAGYRSLNGKPIKHTTIESILRNPKYKGYYCGGKVSVVDYRTKKQIFNDEKDWVMYKDETGEIVPKIVDENTWDKCNEVLKSRVSSYNGNKKGVKYATALSGKIICGVHNCSFHSVSRKYTTVSGEEKLARSWSCKAKRELDRQCETLNISNKNMVKILGEYLIYISKNVDSQIDKFLELYKQANSHESTSNKLAKYKSELSVCEKKKDKLFELYTDDYISGKEFKERNEQIAMEINELQFKIQDLEENSNNYDSMERKVRDLKQFLSQNFTGEITEDTVMSFVKTAINKIVVYPVDKKSMKLLIVMGFGRQDNVDVELANSIVSSVHISKKMSTELTMKVPIVNGHGIRGWINIEVVGMYV